jgi:hypothetical protein
MVKLSGTIGTFGGLPNAETSVAQKKMLKLLKHLVWLFGRGGQEGTALHVQQ